MLSRRGFMAAGAAGLALGALPGRASAKLIALPRPLPPSTAIAGGDFVAAPTAWLRLVARFPALHPGAIKPCRVPSTKLREAELVQVQREVNGKVRFQREAEDLWQPASLTGDCEDFAIRKLIILTREFGWPRGALTLATCTAETGQGHAVLLAHTERGAYALDNRRGPVLPWRALPYDWRAREAPGSPFALWRSIDA
ncbi:transglutaminase-like cysteine peptidase [Pelagibius marinus]|uniref:transglutaminase-like cysteine peptidase n=1 Tax=Pelagibius marinus TaxID=2762760 RepID=UPI00187307D2|nr:transglutaminase-like cysteine peptidase [Pelagibius marinus]